MMGCANQVEEMSLYEYEERLWHWCEAHNGDEHVDLPDFEVTERLIAKAAADPRLTN